MRTAAAWTFTLLVGLVACAAQQGRVHAPPSGGEGDAHAEAAAGGGAVREVRYDEPFSLAYGRRVKMEHGETRARFAALLEDSRCPTGV